MYGAFVWARRALDSRKRRFPARAVAVYHDDEYPPGNGQLGPDPKLLRGRNIGADFSSVQGSEKWGMYHGESVPGFPKHPHRGFETVTLCRKGRCD